MKQERHSYQNGLKNNFTIVDLSALLVWRIIIIICDPPSEKVHSGEIVITIYDVI